MPELVRELGQYLIDQAVCTGFTKDIFLSLVPDKPDSVVALTEYAGGGIEIGIESMPRRFQVLARDLDDQAVYQKIWNIFNKLIKFDQPIITIGERDVITQAIQQPFRLSIDEQERTTYVFNLVITTTGD